MYISVKILHVFLGKCMEVFLFLRNAVHDYVFSCTYMSFLNALYVVCSISKMCNVYVICSQILTLHMYDIQFFENYFCFSLFCYVIQHVCLLFTCVLYDVQIFSVLVGKNFISFYSNLCVFIFLLMCMYVIFYCFVSRLINFQVLHVIFSKIVTLYMYDVEFFHCFVIECSKYVYLCFV